MNRNKMMWTWVGALSALASTISANPASISVALSQSRLYAGRPQTVYIKVALTGAPGVSAVRAPVNTALVLDHSGSMAGDKLRHAQEAALQALEHLGPQDIVAVLAYDSNVTVLVPATRATDKAEIARAIRSLRPGSSTALYAGVSRGAHEVRKFLGANRVNRIILLSDGLANVGPSSPETLAELGVSLAKEGIAVSTIGLGLDYNEDLMSRLARASDGNHVFVEHPSRLAGIFEREFGELLSVVARDVEVQITCPAGVRPIRVLGRDAEISGQRVGVRLGHLSARQERYVLLEAEVAPHSAGYRLEVAQVEVGLMGARAGRARATLSARASLAFSARAAEIEASVDHEVMVAVVEQVGNENNKRAIALRDRGQVEQAIAALQSNAAYLSEQAARLKSEKLRRQGQSNAAATSNLNEAQWGRQRKQMREEQHQVDTQQSYRGTEQEQK